MIRAALFASAALLLAASPAAAHHGWTWAGTDNFALEGTIREVRLGNPHGEMKVEDAAGALWTVELGQPWRHAQAGLPEAEVKAGASVRLEGHRSLEEADLRVKAERIDLAGARYNLYPDRD
jgi:hypothetical protein